MDPRSSLMETKSSWKESSFLAQMPLIKSVGALKKVELWENNIVMTIIFSYSLEKNDLYHKL